MVADRSGAQRQGVCVWLVTHVFPVLFFFFCSTASHVATAEKVPKRRYFPSWLSAAAAEARGNAISTLSLA